MPDQLESKELKITAVTKNFSQGGEVTHALRSVDFQARLGELVMIVGPSGSGKTTLLSVIAGTLSADMGTIDLFGFTLSGAKSSAITSFRKRNIGFIFQQFHLIPTLTCAENISIPLILNGVAPEEIKPRIKEVLSEVGIEEKYNAFPKQLSGGQQQRVAIARALVHHPHLIICDEPTSALDAETGSNIMEIIRHLAIAKDRCVIVVTHDARIFKYADRTVNMDDGRIRSEEKNHR